MSNSYGDYMKTPKVDKHDLQDENIGTSDKKNLKNALLLLIGMRDGIRSNKT